jgi:16S rRNA (uracil1498-N3)-methyltransferase
MELFYLEQADLNLPECTLDLVESQHIIQSLRKKTGDVLQITNGRGCLFSAEIVSLKKAVTVKLTSLIRELQPQSELTIAVAFIKPSRFEFILEKGTELGVRRFIFFRSRYANYASSNTDRFEKILRSAMKQSLQLFMPEIQVFSKFDDFIEHCTDRYAEKFYAADAKSNSLLGILLKNGLNSRSHIIAIGPEGGFTGEESDIFQHHHFLPVGLGPNRLRTETAAICASAILAQFVATNTKL